MLTLFCLLYVSITFAQDSLDTESNSKKFKADGHWAGLDVGTIILTNDQRGTDFNEYDYWQNDILSSSCLSVNFFEYKLPFFKQFIGLTTGLGYHLNTIGLRGNYRIQHNADTVFASQNLFQAYRMNVVNVHYFTIPLLFEIASGQRQKKSFYLNAGVVAGIRFASSTRQTGKYANGDRFNLMVNSRFNLMPYSLEATVRMGYSHFGLFASYGLTRLFKEGKTVDVFPLRAGITLNISVLDFD